MFSLNWGMNDRGKTRIDLDNDSSIDIEFSWGQLFGSLYFFDANLYNGTQILADPSYAYPLFAGYLLNRNSWYWASSSVSIDKYDRQNFQLKGERYIGFRIGDSIDYHYGWMLVEFGDDTASTGYIFSMKSFAIEDSLNTSIIAGNNGVSIEIKEFSNEFLELYPTIVTKDLNIKSDIVLKGIEIHNLSGVKVYSKKLSGREMEQQSIDMSDLKSGIYIVSLVGV